MPLSLMIVTSFGDSTDRSLSRLSRSTSKVCSLRLFTPIERDAVQFQNHLQLFPAVTRSGHPCQDSSATRSIFRSCCFAQDRSDKQHRVGADQARFIGFAADRWINPSSRAGRFSPPADLRQIFIRPLKLHSSSVSAEMQSVAAASSGCRPLYGMKLPDGSTPLTAMSLLDFRDRPMLRCRLPAERASAKPRQGSRLPQCGVPLRLRWSIVPQTFDFFSFRYDDLCRGT